MVKFIINMNYAQKTTALYAFYLFMDRMTLKAFKVSVSI